MFSFGPVLWVVAFVCQGSTCAFTEQILRSHGFRTGFYR